MWLAEPRAAGLRARRRHLAGPTGCGLCGIETLAEAMRPPPLVRDGRSLAPGDVLRAIESVAPLQTINRETRAVHAAAFWHPAVGLIALREDVGRHNALDKLGGALARGHVPVEGADNTMLLEGLDALGSPGRGVAVIDPARTSKAMLDF
jgi:FdhD protein